CTSFAAQLARAPRPGQRATFAHDPPARGLPPVIGDRRERGAGDRPRRTSGPCLAGLEHARARWVGGVPHFARRVRSGPAQRARGTSDCAGGRGGHCGGICSWGYRLRDPTIQATTHPLARAHLAQPKTCWPRGHVTMAWLSLASLRTRLLLLVLLAVVPALGLTLYTNLEERQLRKALVHEHTMRLSRLVSADYERLIDDAQQLLVTLAQLPAVHDLNRPACNPLLVDLLAQRSSYANLGVIDNDGNVFCTAVPGQVYLGDRVYFRRAL